MLDFIASTGAMFRSTTKWRVQYRRNPITIPGMMRRMNPTTVANQTRIAAMTKGPKLVSLKKSPIAGL